jgi:hypothetical protein
VILIDLYAFMEKAARHPTCFYKTFANRSCMPQADQAKLLGDMRSNELLEHS